MLSRLGTDGGKTARPAYRTLVSVTHDAFPLTTNQQAMWLHEELLPGTAAYVLQYATDMSGPLDVDGLCRAVAKLSDFHDALLVRVERSDEGIHQWVDHDIEHAPVVVDGTDWDDAAVDGFLDDLAQRPFDLAADPLFRFHLVERGEDEWVLTIGAHHIVADMWSMALVTDALDRLYAAEVGLDVAPPVASNYQTVIAAVGQTDPELDASHRSFWLDRLAGAEPLLVPADRPRIPGQSSLGDTVSWRLGDELWGRLSALGKAVGTTPDVVLLGVWNVLLHRLTGATDLSVGSPRANRGMRSGRAVGYFVNLVVIRSELDPVAGFADNLRRLDAIHRATVRHDRYPFASVADVLASGRELGVHPLLRVDFAWQKTSTVVGTRDVSAISVGAGGSATERHGITTVPRPLPRREVPHDLMLLATADGDDVGLTIEFASGLFDRGTVETFRDQFISLAEAMVADADAAVGSLARVRPAEAAALVELGRGPTEAVPFETLPARFADQVAARPTSPAIRDSYGDASYADVHRWSETIREALDDAGLRRGDHVAIALERHAGWAAAVLACQRSGMPHLSLDRSTPADRLAAMVAGVGTAAVLIDSPVDFATGESAVVAIPGRGDVPVGPAAPDAVLGVDETAYFTYTSGSTGEPKPVETTHGNLVNYLRSASTSMDFDSGVVAPAWISFGFEPALVEWWQPLLFGGVVVVADEDTRLDQARLVDFCRSAEVNMLGGAPSVWRALVAAGWTGHDDFRCIVGGEALDDDLAQELRRRSRFVLNTYGPTETTVWSTLEEVGDAPVTLGRPIRNTSIYLLDETGCLLPEGARGEIWIGGAGVARGYRGMPKLTSDRFRPDPFVADPEAQMYRTGDVGRWAPDGRLEFHGRVDFQLKIRGNRIEPSEIESAFLRLDKVEAAVVSGLEQGSDTELVAHLVGSATADDLSEIRRHLRLVLPEVMVPSRIMVLPQFPLDASGKVDRAALPTPDRLPRGEPVAPRSATESDLLAIWIAVLGPRLAENSPGPLGIDDDFFELGGHSLLATQIVSRIRVDLGREVPVRAVFEASTVRSLAELVAEAPAVTEKSVELLPRGEPFALSDSQARMWFLHQVDPQGSAYNIAGAIEVHAALDFDSAAQAIDDVVARHEPLRTSFALFDGEPMQTIHPEITGLLEYRDWREHDPATLDGALQRAMEADARTPFDLGAPSQLRATAHRLPDDRWVLFFAMHHIVGDQWSSGILANDLAVAYDARIEGRAPKFVPLEFQYVDYARWRDEWLDSGEVDDQIAYWAARLADPPVLDLPTDRPRPRVLPTGGGIEQTEVPEAVRGAADRLARRAGASPFMVYLAAFAALLHRYTGATDICIGTPIANRNTLQSESMVSSLVNTLVIRLQFDDQTSFDSLLSQTRERALEAYANQDVPFERVVQELGVARDTSRAPVFQVFFNMLNAPFETPDLNGQPVELLPIDRGGAQFDLAITVDVAELDRFTAEYNSTLFNGASMVRLLGHLVTLLDSAGSDPAAAIGRLGMVGSAELNQARRYWADAAIPVPDVTLPALVAAQAHITPDAPAVRAGDARKSLGAVDAAANRLARWLVERGVGSGDTVGLALERSTRVPVAMVGVNRVGAAFVPLDAGLPDDRIRFMLEDSGTSLVLAEGERVAALTDVGVEVVDLGDPEVVAALAALSPGPTEIEVGPEDLCWIVYTSGSTGRPKGAEIEHRGAVNLFRSMERDPGSTQDDVVMCVTSLSFDPSIQDTYLSLITGAEVVYAPTEVVLDGAALAALLDEVGATQMFATPTVWQLLLDSGWEGRPSFSARSGGEPLSRELATALRQRCQSVWNLYGLTELTVWSSAHRVGAGTNTVPVGRPIDNTSFYILDGSGQPLPVGVPGELVIGGMGVGRGFRNRPEFNDSHFVPDPFSGQTNARMYRTGDIARHRPDGTLEFLGRRDSQIKIRGHRIELGELEVQVSSQPGIVEAAAAAYEAGPGDQRLAVYVVEAGGHSVDSVALREELGRVLPDYMVPTAVVPIETIPLTNSGKVDRRSLPVPTAADVVARPWEAPRRGHEQLVAEVWQAVLGIGDVGRHDNFFDLGGHSLLAIRVFARLEAETTASLPLTTLFRAPTVAQLAALLDAPEERPQQTSLVPVHPHGTKRPFFSVAPFLITTLSYQLLSRHLGADQPLYAFQPQGMESDIAPHSSVDEMAAHYITEMRTVQPQGPYLLGGHCAGNWVAFEMARQLQEMGEEVDLLVLVDGEPPGFDPPKYALARRIIDRARHYRSLGRLRDAFAWQLGLLWQRLWVRRLGRADRRRVARVVDVHALAHATYVPGRFTGGALFIRSEESAHLSDRDWHLQWRYLLDGPLQVETVPGSHATLMLLAENTEAMAAHISAAVAASRR